MAFFPRRHRSPAPRPTLPETLIRPGQRVLRLQGYPWDSFYIATQLKDSPFSGGEYDVVVANGYEYHAADLAVPTEHAAAVRRSEPFAQPEDTIAERPARTPVPPLPRTPLLVVRD